MENESDKREMRGAEDFDLVAIVRKLWRGRKLIVWSCVMAAVAALIAAFSIPKEYTASAVLSPELPSVQMSTGVGALAGMMGFNIAENGQDAVYPILYPEVVMSAPFIAELFSVEVSDRKGEMQATLYDYLLDRCRRPWWSHLISAPFAAVERLVEFWSDERPTEGADVDPYRFTAEQMKAAKSLRSRIAVSVDRKTSVITLRVTMQDPVVAAAVADAVIENLQRYITSYRTSKARRDLEFAEHLCEESRMAYETAQSRYAEYVDRNQNVVLRRVRIEEERLQNEMQLAYNVYNQTSQQLQLARAKVQEMTPVYAVVSPVTVPLRASRPSKPMIIAVFVFLAGAGSSAWIIFGRDVMSRIREK